MRKSARRQGREANEHEQKTKEKPEEGDKMRKEKNLITSAKRVGEEENKGKGKFIGGESLSVEKCTEVREGGKNQEGKSL